MRAVLLLIPLCLACNGSPRVVSPDTDGADPATDTAVPSEDTAEDVGESGPDTADSTDGTDGTDGTDPVDLEPGIYQGTLQFTLTRDEPASYSGKLGVKVRADRVFSGTGTASSAGQPAASVKVSGFVEASGVDGTLELTLAGSDPLEIALNGHGAGQTLLLTFNGGSQGNKVQGSVELQRTGE